MHLLDIDIVLVGIHEDPIYFYPVNIFTLSSITIEKR